MKTLTLYIVREILKASLLAAVVLLALFMLFTFADEARDMGKGDYGLREVLLYLALTAPRVFYELIPSAALLGSLFVLGAMANNREIVSMRAAGMSVYDIIKSVLLAGFLLVVFSILIGEFVAPPAERAAQILKTTSENKQVSIGNRYGLWLRDGDLFINIRQIFNDKWLSDLYLYQLNQEGQLKLMSHAERADFRDHKSWLVSNIEQSELIDNKVVSRRIDEEIWRSSIDADLMEIVVVKPDNLSLYDLMTYIQFLKKNNQKAEIFELAFWSRLFNPLVTVVMLLVATPFVTGVHRTVSLGNRLMVGVLFGMSFNIIDKIVGNVGLIYHLNPLLMALLPSFAVLSVALIAFRKFRY